MRCTLILLLCLGCDDSPGTSAADTGAECVTADLVAQCPAGSNPLLGAQAASSCEGAASGVIVDRTGQATGQCYGVGSCRVACQFAVPCRCGVASVTRDGVVCADCEGAASCGNGVCEGGETPENCAIDCGAECEPAELRCDGEELQECNLQGRWDRLPCPEGEVCSADDGPAGCVPDPGIVVGGDSGVGDAGMVDESRVIAGTNLWPAIVDASRGAPPPRLSPSNFAVPIQRGCINNVRTPFGQLLRTGFNPTAWRPRAGGGAEGFGVGGSLRFDAEGELVPTSPRPAPPVDEAAFCAAYLGCFPERDEANCRNEYDARTGGPDGPAVAACYAENLRQDCESGTLGCLVLNVHPFPERTQLRGALVRERHRVVGVSGDGSAAVLVDLTEGTVTTHEPLPGFQISGVPGSIALSADGRFVAFVATQFNQQIIGLWSVETGERQALLPQDNGNIQRLALSPGGEVLAMLMLDTEDAATHRVVSLWDLRDESRIFSLRPLDDQGGIGRIGIGFSPDGRTLAVDIGTAVELWTPGAEPERAHTLEFDGRQRVRDLRFDPSGQTIATLFDEVSLWEVATGQRQQTLDVRQQTTPKGLGFSADGQTLLSVQQDAGVAYLFSAFAP